MAGKDPEHTYTRTQCGVFDYFDGLCHACSSGPTVVLERKSLVQKSPYEDHGAEEFGALGEYKSTIPGGAGLATTPTPCGR